MNAEDQDMVYEEMVADLETGECVTINEKGEIYFCGKWIAQINSELSRDQAFELIRSHMDAQGYFPDIYEVNDHGNVTLLSLEDKELRSWV